MSNREKRFTVNTEYYCRNENADGSEQSFVEGVGIVYNQTTELYQGVYEKILPGTFTASLSDNHTVKSFINHNPTEILSTTKSDPALQIIDNSEGLQFKSPIPPTSYGNDLIVNLERGNIKGASFSFTINEGGEIYETLPDGSLLRTITSAEIYEVGPVTNPAYEQTEVGLRSKEFFDNMKRKLDEKEYQDTRQLDIIKEFLQKRKGL